jgi:hypothetical protein
VIPRSAVRSGRAECVCYFFHLFFEVKFGVFNYMHNIFAAGVGSGDCRGWACWLVLMLACSGDCHPRGNDSVQNVLWLVLGYDVKLHHITAAVSHSVLINLTFRRRRDIESVVGKGESSDGRHRSKCITGSLQSDSSCKFLT